jgi:hypothetical protein
MVSGEECIGTRDLNPAEVMYGNNLKTCLSNLRL